MISVLSNGIKNTTFNFSYQNRENTSVFEDLGHTIMRIAEKTPGGILMFFPSYRLMETCYEAWQNYDIVNKIDRVKTLLKEPKDPS